MLTSQVQGTVKAYAMNPEVFFHKNILLSSGNIQNLKIDGDLSSYQIFSLQNNQKEEGIELLRGEEAHVLKNIYPDFHLDESFPAPVFYKDQAFHAFQGRKTPAPLLAEEKFFSQKAYKLLVPQETLLEAVTLIRFKKIEKSSNGWKLYTNKNSVYECENLCFHGSPYEFFELYQGKEELSSELYNFFLNLKPHNALVLKLRSPLSIMPQGTFFIPQSLTHDLGHFILETQGFKDSLQKINALFFLSVEDSSTEEISKKIRHLKNTCGRIFPEFKKAKMTESIGLESFVPVVTYQKEFFDLMQKELPHLKIIGKGAPLADSFLKQQGMTDINSPLLCELLALKQGQFLS
ncbi:MAG: hypothetical protein KBD63_06820 [Bacteriovoracaceae bacterium]|nr:hypothetical protein [Bacteriovoracaceae bacterium]